MFDEMGPKFLAALVEAAAQRFGADDKIAVGFREAASKADIALARRLLGEMAPADGDALLAAAHRRLSHDASAVLANLRAPPGARPN